MVAHNFTHGSNQRWGEVWTPYHTRCWSEDSSVSIVMRPCAGGARVWILSEAETRHFATLSLVTLPPTHSLIRRELYQSLLVSHCMKLTIYLNLVLRLSIHAAIRTLPNFWAQWLIKHWDKLTFTFNAKCWSRHENKSHMISTPTNAHT
jgi:hypothetical protein